jgi:hypothetical protein
MRAPDWTGTPSGIQLVIESRPARVEPRHLRLDIGSPALGRPTEAVLRRCPPGDEVSAPRQQGAPFRRLGLGHGAPRGTHRVCHMREGAGSEAMRLGQWARGCGNVARVARIDHRDGQARCSSFPVRGHTGESPMATRPVNNNCFFSGSG